jgi:hypothetical protein
MSNSNNNRGDQHGEWEAAPPVTAGAVAVGHGASPSPSSSQHRSMVKNEQHQHQTKSLPSDFLAHHVSTPAPYRGTRLSRRVLQEEEQGGAPPPVVISATSTRAVPLCGVDSTISTIPPEDESGGSTLEEGEMMPPMATADLSHVRKSGCWTRRTKLLILALAVLVIVGAAVGGVLASSSNQKTSSDSNEETSAAGAPSGKNVLLLVGPSSSCYFR